MTAGITGVYDVNRSKFAILLRYNQICQAGVITDFEYECHHAGLDPASANVDNKESFVV